MRNGEWRMQNENMTGCRKPMRRRIFLCVAAGVLALGLFWLDCGLRKSDDEIAGGGVAADPHHREGGGGAGVDAAVGLPQEKPPRPFFCWVHLYDPHAPYNAHADLFGDEFADRPYDGEIA